MINDNQSLAASNSPIYNNFSSLINEKFTSNVILSTASDIWTTFTTTSQNDILNLSNYYNISTEINSFLPCDPRNYYFNCTKDDYLLFCRGPQRLPLFTALMVTVFFVGIFVTGVVGNVIVCVVIVKQSALHTATNYYLFSLAVSDLMLLLGGLPFEISIFWHQYPYNMGLPFCKLRALISEASSYVSVLTIVAFSMERFLAICHPLHLYTMSGFKRALRIIAALWIISFLSAAPFAIFTEIDYIEYPPDRSKIQKSAFCAMLENPPGFPLWELSFCLFFVIPMILIMILYGRMGWQIRSRTKTTKELGVTQGSMHKESRQHQSRKAIIRMLAAVVITFFVCWAPFHAQRLAYLYLKDWTHFEDVNTWLFSVAGWFYYVSCTLNPVLYNVMSHRYRVAFKETLCGRRRTFKHDLAREQSSFRETVASTAGYESSHLVRVRSVRSSNYKDRNSINANMVCKNNNISTRPTKMDDAQTIDKNIHTDVERKDLKTSTAGKIIAKVVVIENSLNGRPKLIMTNNENQDNLQQKKNETYI